MTTLSGNPFAAAPVAPPVSSGPADLVSMADRFAAMPADEAEQLIESYIVHAVAQWRVVDATFWQRVKYRSRLTRAAAQGRSGAHGSA